MSERTAPQGASLPETSVVVLAGGRGERLGRDKADVALGGKTLLERSLCLLRPLSDDLVVALRAGQGASAPGARVVYDRAPHAGVLAGLAAGLGAVRHPYAFVVACDMPFLEPRLIGHLRSLAEGYDAVVPRREVGLEPLHAVYARHCVSAVLRALESGRRRVISFYEELRVRYVPEAELGQYDPEQRAFFNINTPEDLERARRWLAQGDRCARASVQR